MGRMPARLRAWGHVLESRLPGHTVRPHAAHVLITWRCNLRCDTCRAWTLHEEGELDAASWARVFSRLRSLDIVKIIGGEPFVRADLGEVVESIRHQVDPYVLQLVTNGTMTERVVEFVRRHAWRNLHLRVSLDGLEATHDAARGIPGTFSKAMATLTELAAVRRSRPFQLGVNFTVTDASLPEMAELVERCGRLGADLVAGFRVKPFLRHCNISTEECSTVGVVDRQRVLAHLVAPDHGARNGFLEVERRALAVLNKTIFRKHAAGGAALRFRCQELRHLMYVNPRGELITCGLNHMPLGSLLAAGPEELLRSQSVREARSRVEQCPGCMQGAVEVMSRLYG